MGKACLHLPIDGELAEPHFKRMIIRIIGFINMIFCVLLFSQRARKIIKGHCPDKKMSSIGKYRRNLIDFDDTLALSIISSIIGMWPILWLLEYNIYFKQTQYTLSPKDVFTVESLFDLFYSEGFISILTFALSLRDVPVTKEAPRQTIFYVRSPKGLEPRRPPPPPASRPFPPPPPPPSPLPPLKITTRHPPVTKMPDRIILVQESLDDEIQPEVSQTSKHHPVTRIPDRIILVQESLEDEIHPEVSQTSKHHPVTRIPDRGILVQDSMDEIPPEVSQKEHGRAHQEVSQKRNITVHHKATEERNVIVHGK